MQHFNGILLNNIEFTDEIPLNNSEFNGIPLQTTVNLEEFLSIKLNLEEFLSITLKSVKLNTANQWDPIHLH